MSVVINADKFRDELAKRLEPTMATLTPTQRAAVKNGLVTALAETIAVCLSGGMSIDGHTSIPAPTVKES